MMQMINAECKLFSLMWQRVGVFPGGTRGLPSVLGLIFAFLDNWHAPCNTPCMTRSAHPAPEPFDVQRRFVRIIEEHANGLVEFEFAVGEPELYAEMVLHRAAFEEFCGTQGVVPTHGGLPEPDAETQDAQWDWNLRDARERHGRKPV